MSFYSSPDIADLYQNGSIYTIPTRKIKGITKPSFDNTGSRIRVIIGNVDNTTGRAQVGQANEVSTWTREDQLQVRYMAKILYYIDEQTPASTAEELRAQGMTGPEVVTALMAETIALQSSMTAPPVETQVWAPGLQTLYGYMSSSWLTPEWVIDLMKDAINTPLQPESLPVVDPRMANIPQAALNIGAGGAPTHIGLVGKSNWLGFDDAVNRKGLINAVDRIIRLGPTNYCSLVALMAAGATASTIGDNPDEFWHKNNMTDIKFADHLIKKNVAFKIYDGLCRLVHQNKTAGKTMYFVTSAGHVTAFKSTPRKEDALRVFLKKVQSDDAGLEQCSETWKYKGKHTMEVDIFKQYSGISAPRFIGPLQGNLFLDQRKSYPSVLMNVNNVFPIAGIYSHINEQDPVRMRRKVITRHGFYLIDLSFASGEERIILGGGSRVAWMYGDVILKSWKSAEFIISGEFICEESKPGAIPVTPIDLKTVVDFSGCLEKGTSTISYEGYSAGVQEVQHHVYETARLADYRVVHGIENIAEDNNTRSISFAKDRHWKTTGMPAKLALYQYVAYDLLCVWREVKGIDSKAMLTKIKTDCIGMMTTATGVSMMGPEIGQFKHEKHKPETASESYPKVRSSLKSVTSTQVTKEDVIAKFKSTNRINVAVCGPAGCGKTHFFLTVLKPMIEEAGIEVLTISSMVSHVNRLQEEGVLDADTNANFVDGHDLCNLREKLKHCVLVMDEIGLATAHHFSAIKYLSPPNMIFIGDRRQLTYCGDVTRVIDRLGLDTVTLDSHSGDRFNGDPKMLAAIEMINPYIDSNEAMGAHANEGGSIKFPTQLMIDMFSLFQFIDVVQAREMNIVSIVVNQNITHAAAVAMYDSLTGKDAKRVGALIERQYPKKPGQIENRGWRHSVMDRIPYGRTIHSSQGATFQCQEIVYDWKCDPRLLLVAMSRVRSFGDLFLVI
jgi:hypothetical protein